MNLEKAGQSIYASRIGSKFFPGHCDIVITIDDENISHYELYTAGDLDLPEYEFEKKILENFGKTNKNNAKQIKVWHNTCFHLTIHFRQSCRYERQILKY